MEYRSKNSKGVGCVAPRSAHLKANDSSDARCAAIHERRNHADFASPTASRAPEPSLFWRMLGGTAVLVLFAVGASVGRGAGVWDLKPGRRGTPGTTTVVATETTMLRVPQAPLVQASDSSSLAVKATNEYGEFDRVALALYGLEMIVEPYRETTLSVEGGASSTSTLFHWRIVESDDSGIPLVNADPVFDVVGGREVVVMLTIPGGVYLLTVEELPRDGTTVAQGTVKINCKYVRREIRDLSEVDRVGFLDALKVYYTVPTDVGKALYGEMFMNYKYITAVHNSQNFCYHGGLQFFTAHLSFGLMMEKAIQAVNPRVSMPLWDYTIETATLGVDWEQSPIFSDDMFGRTQGSPGNSHQLTEGRFANISTIFDPDNTFIGEDISPNHNAYGYIAAEYNYKDLPYMARTNSFCSLKGHSMLPSSETFFDCFYNSDSLYSWDNCVETFMHSDTHDHFGGAFNCAMDVRNFHDEHPEYSPEMLTFVFMTVTGLWNKQLMSDYNDCDTQCERGTSEPCGCTCTIDAFTVSEDLVYSIASTYMTTLYSVARGTRYISYDETSDRPWGFVQDGVRLPDEETMLLLRVILKIGCEPGSLGTVVTNASPMDPLFWLFHPIFEKGMHILWMSPKYRDTYDFDWVAGTCYGSAYNDLLPISEKALGMGSGTDFLTNADLMSILHADNPRLPFVYEKFDSWGTTKGWNFCPECVEAAFPVRESGGS